MALSDGFEDLAAVRQDIIEDVVTFARRRRQLDGLLRGTDDMRADVALILETLRRDAVGRERPA